MCRSLFGIFPWVISRATLHAWGGHALPEEQAGNGLRYSSVVGTPEYGPCELGMTMRRNECIGFLSFELPVNRAVPPMLARWPAVALMPLGIHLTIWRGLILKKRRIP